MHRPLFLCSSATLCASKRGLPFATDSACPRGLWLDASLDSALHACTRTRFASAAWQNICTARAAEHAALLGNPLHPPVPALCIATPRRTPARPAPAPETSERPRGQTRHTPPRRLSMATELHMRARVHADLLASDNGEVRHSRKCSATARPHAAAAPARPKHGRTPYTDATSTRGDVGIDTMKAAPRVRWLDPSLFTRPQVHTSHKRHHGRHANLPPARSRRLRWLQALRSVVDTAVFDHSVWAWQSLWVRLHPELRRVTHECYIYIQIPGLALSERNAQHAATCCSASAALVTAVLIGGFCCCAASYRNQICR